MSNKHFTCVSIGFGGTPRIVERVADSAEKAADAHTTATHKAYWSEAWRSGEDRHGSYSEFTLRSGSAVAGTVRVYESYKY